MCLIKRKNKKELKELTARNRWIRENMANVNVKEEAFPELTKKVNSTKGLKCGHLNVNGLLSKIDQIRTLLNESKLHILAISETHLSDETSDDELSIENYLFERKDRENRKNHWGGVLIYYANYLIVDEVVYNANTGITELLFIDIMLRNERLLLACIYRPKEDKKFINTLEIMMTSFSHRKNVLLLGDFNIDLFKDSSLVAALERAMYTNNLTNMIKEATRITETSSTLIDLALTTNPSYVNNNGSFNTCISDHNLIYTTFKVFYKQRKLPKLITVKNKKNIDLNKLKYDLECTPWLLIDLFDDPDDSLWCWEKLLKDTISAHVKERKVKVRSDNQPWMTGDIRKHMNERYKLFNKAKGTPKKSNEWILYRRKRNFCTNLIRQAKANYWKTKFENTDSSKSFWKTVKQFNGTSKTPIVGPLMDDNKNTICNDLEKANLMNNFFATVGEKLSNENESNTVVNMNSYIYRVTPTISELEPDIDLFKKCFKSAVKIGKANGPDNISGWDLKVNELASINGLFRVFQKSVQKLSFPEKWKKAKVTCLYKNKGSKKNCGNYRPVSLLSIPSKVIEKYLCTLLNNHLENFKLQSNCQWGFRKNSSCEDLLLHMTESWLQAVDHGKTVIVLFIDFQKAFDSVSHPILLKKLSAIGVSGQLLEYIKNYLQNRKQYTIVNGIQSNLKNVRFGVPQGSLLGPDCFSTHVNDMPEETTSDTDVEDSELNLFADDSTAYEFGNSVDDTFDKLAETVKNIELYARKNSLTIHPGKCKILVISKQKFVGPLKAINIYNKPVEVVHSTKCLGVTIDRNLSWEPHISNVCKKFNAKVKKLFKLRIMSTNVLNTIYFQGILPAALYSILIWGSSTHLPDVNKIHIKAARFIMKIKKDIPDHMVLQHAGWKPIDHYYKRSLACKAYKIYNGLSPDPLNCLLTKSHARKNRNLFKTELPKFNYVPFKKSFRYRGSNVWNVLSNDLRGKPTFESFKNQLRKEDLGKITFGSLATGKAKYHNDFLYF